MYIVWLVSFFLVMYFKEIIKGVVRDLCLILYFTMLFIIMKNWNSLGI